MHFEKKKTRYQDEPLSGGKYRHTEGNRRFSRLCETSLNITSYLKRKLCLFYKDEALWKPYIFSTGPGQPGSCPGSQYVTGIIGNTVTVNSFSHARKNFCQNFRQFHHAPSESSTALDRRRKSFKNIGFKELRVMSRNGPYSKTVADHFLYIRFLGLLASVTDGS